MCFRELGNHVWKVLFCVSAGSILFCVMMSGCCSMLFHMSSALLCNVMFIGVMLDRSCSLFDFTVCG